MVVPILEDEIECGSLCTERRGLYMTFRAELNTSSLCRLFAVFDSGQIALGVPAPEQGKMRMYTSIPVSRLPEGKLLQGVLRPCGDEWLRFPGGTIGQFTFPPGYRKGITYRFRWEGGDRLPCEELMCFFRLVCERNCSYLEINLDQNGCPTE